jgi:acetyl-CoA carboxylase carboxyl transferase subunit alpha
MKKFLDFEKDIAGLEDKIEELKRLSSASDLNIMDEVSKLQIKLQKALSNTYENLTPWQTVQVARHPDRPKCLEYISALFQDFVELSGDRLFGQDAAIVGGIAKFFEKTVMIIGQEKGNDTTSRIHHNFGMPRPEGYRKAQRLMMMADHFDIPIVTFVDTAGAYPGIDAEERGQANAIATSIDICLKVKVPIITFIIGEGGSGGAIAIATSNNVFMLEHSIYSVISPEGCASILWKSASKAKEAAESQRLTSKDLKNFGIIDAVVKEPLGGAHRDKSLMFDSVKKLLKDTLDNINTMVDFASLRREKYLKMTSF